MTGRLTIAGLGPGDPALRGLAVQAALDQAGRVILRTAVHPGLDELVGDPRVSNCDDLYESGASFDAVYAAIVERVVQALSTGDVVYAVPGSPTQGERTVRALRERCREAQIEVIVLPSVGALDALAVEFGLDLLADEPHIVDAMSLAAFVAAEPFSGGFPPIEPTRPAIVCQLYSQAVTSAVKLALIRLYPEDHQVELVSGAGVPGAVNRVSCPLFAIDRQPVDHLTSMFVPALPATEAARAPATIHRISARLRREDGCPWDRKQTHASLREAVLEEAYEVVDAIDTGSPDDLAEELGDLLLQVGLHAQLAEEAGEFTASDVHEAVNRKLVRRHPHVFRDTEAETAEAVIRTWNGVKAAERAAKGLAPELDPDPLDTLPRSMPFTAKLRHLESRPAVTTGDLERAADLALAALSSLIAAGGDPDRELERAYRRRAAASRTIEPETGITAEEARL